MTGRPRPFAMRALLAGCFALVATATATTARADVLKIGDRLAELDVATDAAGKPVKLKSFKGKWVVLTVGADWCKPCAKELPTWDKLAGELKGKVVFLAVDIDDEIDVGKKFHDKLKLRNMVRVYMPSEKSSVAGSYGSDHMPSTFVANGQGIVQLVREGFETGDADGEYKKFKDALAKLVK
ncbi:MAG TPA: TlpA disulfide reductase family protein [Kofleriaceae bacterium]